MGVLRVFLACIVFVAHLPLGVPGAPAIDFFTIGATEAVELFFLVSGFYMALVLHERYVGPGSYRLFLTNRALRLYPQYWAVAAFAAVLWIAFGTRIPQLGPPSAFDILSPAGATLITLANAAILGQDVVMFAGVTPTGTLELTATPFAYFVQPWYFLLVPQAWTLSIEFMFYAVAPLLVRRRLRVLLTVLCASLAVRVLLIAIPETRRDPWTYRFFPAELSLFIVGVLGYRMLPWLTGRPMVRRVAISLFLLALLSFGTLPGPALLTRWPLYALAGVAVPSLFVLSRDWRLDRAIGELSYPIYISHLLVLVFLPPLLPPLPTGGMVAVCAIVTLAVSFALIQLVAEPVEAIRRRRVDRTAPRAL
jgi:peptidoglycan/LPS O-acetylase OafA/YrhL